MNQSDVYRIFGICLLLVSLALPSAWAQSFEEGGDVESIEAVQDGGDIQGGGGPTPTEADWGGSGRLWLSKGTPPVVPYPPGNPPNAEPLIHTPAVMPYLIRW